MPKSIRALTLKPSVFDVTQVFKHDGLGAFESQLPEMSKQFCLDAARRNLRAVVFAPDLISQPDADLLAVGSNKSFSEATINPNDFAFCQ